MRTMGAVNRRSFLAGLGSAAIAAAGQAHAQQRARLPRVALASGSVSVTDMSESGSDPIWRAIMAEFRATGLIEGQNVIFERYSTLGVTDSTQMGQTIAATRPDVIFVGGSTAMAQAAAGAAPDVPVVFVVGDALASGLVSNLAHPGGNLTGANTTAGVETEGKRIALIHEALPGATRVGFLDQLSAYEPLGHRPVAEAAAANLGLTLIPEIVDRPFDQAVFKAAFDDLAAKGAQILAAANSSNIQASWAISAPLIRAARLPAIVADPTFLDFGGLMSYAADRPLAYSRGASYVALILGGARPGDLPVQQPDRFELAISLKAAAELGIELPQSLLLQATDVRS